MSEFRKLADWSQADIELFHYRDQRNEVDLIIERSDGSVIPIEIKSAASFRPADVKGIKLFEKALGDRVACGLLVYTGERTLQVAERIWAVPACCLWE